jgi:hypothetical protein
LIFSACFWQGGGMIYFIYRRQPPVFSGVGFTMDTTINKMIIGGDRKRLNMNSAKHWADALARMQAVSNMYGGRPRMPDQNIRRVHSLGHLSSGRQER